MTNARCSLLLLIGGLVGWSRPEVSTQPDALGVLLGSLRDSTQAPGLSIAIARDGQILFAAGTGSADREHKVAATSHTLYRIGSVSKLLTAAALARLADRGALEWDANLRKYVPEFPADRPTVTPLLLAGHLAGVRHYRPTEFINAVHHDSVASAVKVFLNDSLLFAPGTRYGYSSFGYVLLSLAIERAAQQPFLGVIQKDVLAPLGLRETAPDRPDSTIPNRAMPYDGGGANPVAPARNDDLSNRWGAGGFLASVTDLARFGSAFLQPGFLTASTLQRMMTPQLLSSGASAPVGIGWRIGQDDRGRRIWHHAGTALGGRAILVVWPDEKIVVAIAGNLVFNQNERAAFRFAELVRPAGSADTTRLSVGSPLVNGRVYAPHAARVRVTVGDSLRSEWTNELTLGDSGGRPVMRWVTRGTRYPPGAEPIRWSILQTYDAVTLAPYGYRSSYTTGLEWQLVIQGKRVTGTRKMPGDSATKPFDLTLTEPGFIASASDLVPLAAGLKAGAVMTAPVWSPALSDSEMRVFAVLQKVPLEIEGSRVTAWKVEERRVRDKSLVATWYLTEDSPYMVYGEVPLPDGRTQRMTEVAIPRP